MAKMVLLEQRIVKGVYYGDMSTYFSSFMRAAGRLLDLGGTIIRRGTRDPNERAVRAMRGAWHDTVAPLQKGIEKYAGARKNMPHFAQSSNTHDYWSSLATAFEHEGMEHEAKLARLRARWCLRIRVSSKSGGS